MMRLPILKSTTSAGPGDLVRFASQVNLEWSRHLSDEVPLDFGRAFANAELASIFDANCLLDATIPVGYAPQEAFDSVNRHFNLARTRCKKWVLNPSTQPSQAAELSRFLTAHSFQENIELVMHLPQLPRLAVQDVTGLRIIPARASFKHFRMLAEEQAESLRAPQWADAAMLHLDDGHCDAMLAMQDGAAAGYLQVMTVGEIGAIAGLFVSENFRRRGIGQMLMSRALEICSRALFRHVLLWVRSTNEPARRLYQRFGFSDVGQIKFYVETL